VEGLKDKVIVFAGAGGIATAAAGFLGAGGARIVVSDVVTAERITGQALCVDGGVTMRP
jgi:phosphoglycerate dehydrogenase-like enzyme